MRKYFMATLLLIVFVCCLEPARTLLSRFLLLEQPTIHQIQEGEWLSKVAIEYYGDASYWRELGLINRAPDGNRVYPGEQIIVPSFEVVEQIRKTRRLSTVNELVQKQRALLASQVETSAPVTESLEDSRAEELSQATGSGPQTEAGSEIEVADEEELEAVVAVAPVEEEAASSAPVVSQKQEDTKSETATTEYKRFVENQDGYAESSFSTMFMAILVGLVLLGVGVYVYVTRKHEEEVAFYGATREENDLEEEEPEQTNARRRPDFLLHLHADKEDEQERSTQNGKANKTETV